MIVRTINMIDIPFAQSIVIYDGYTARIERGILRVGSTQPMGNRLGFMSQRLAPLGHQPGPILPRHPTRSPQASQPPVKA
jgi:hypothetical protein